MIHMPVQRSLSVGALPRRGARRAPAAARPRHAALLGAAQARDGHRDPKPYAARRARARAAARRCLDPQADAWARLCSARGCCRRFCFHADHRRGAAVANLVYCSRRPTILPRYTRLSYLAAYLLGIFISPRCAVSKSYAASRRSCRCTAARTARAATAAAGSPRRSARRTSSRGCATRPTYGRPSSTPRGLVSTVTLVLAVGGKRGSLCDLNAHGDDPTPLLVVVVVVVVMVM